MDKVSVTAVISRGGEARPIRGGKEMMTCIRRTQDATVVAFSLRLSRHGAASPGTAPRRRSLERDVGDGSGQIKSVKRTNKHFPARKCFQKTADAASRLQSERREGGRRRSTSRPFSSFPSTQYTARQPGRRRDEGRPRLRVRAAEPSPLGPVQEEGN